MTEYNKPLRVLIVTPLGLGGKGGIDRLMDELRVMLPRAADKGVEVRYIVSRGQGSILLSPLYVMNVL
ncbi:MAG: hypothetical protein ACXU8U_00465, partial [Asticcacaulis sp.]